MKLLEIVYMMDIKVHQQHQHLTGPGVDVNEQIAEKFHRLVIKKSKRRKDYARSKDNIWAADLV